MQPLSLNIFAIAWADLPDSASANIFWTMGAVIGSGISLPPFLGSFIYPNGGQAQYSPLFIF